MTDSIHPRIVAYLGQDPLILLEELRELGIRRSRLSATVQTLEHRRKIILSELANERRNEGSKITEAALSDYAHSHRDYLSYIDTMQGILEEFGELESEYWAKKSKLDYLNNCLSFAKAESYTLRT
jgi:hypothetical protein